MGGNQIDSWTRQDSTISLPGCDAWRLNQARGEVNSAVFDRDGPGSIRLLRAIVSETRGLSPTG
jgi:hypothetical protein